MPVYINTVHYGRSFCSESWYLQEDGDPSYSIHKAGLARQLKDLNWIVNIKHSTQSLDLNPIEGIWNIIKQRLRQRIFYSDEEVKEAIQEE